MGNLLPQAGEGHSSRFAARDVPFVEGLSATMRAVEGVIRELAQSNVPVLLLAETGAGKQATAQRIHQLSQHGAEPFRSLLCVALQVDDIKALTDSEGRLAKGTIYLEEIADLAAECQSALIGALEQGDGEAASFGSGCGRLICGSARDLEAEVKAGRLREDLYYRISGVCLRLPPLRQRKEDIPGLLEYFLRKYAADFHRAKPEVSPETMRLLQEYSWPSNLRELEDAAKVMVVLEDEKAALGGLRALHKTKPNGNGRVSLKAASKAASREAEKELILNALTRTQWNRRRAAKELQISYKALLYKLKQIQVEGFGAS